MRDRSSSRTAIDPRIPKINATTEHAGFLADQAQALLAPSAKRREVPGELHEG